jgi:hypothetical protein
VVAFFSARRLIRDDFAKKPLGWRHSGFSIECDTRIYSDKARESLCRYIVRPPLSLEKLYYDSETDTVLWHGPKRGHFRSEARYFSGLDFIARVMLHIPPKGKHLVRRYGVYSSRTRGTWKRRPGLALRAAEERYGRGGNDRPAESDAGEELSVKSRARPKAWARLLAKGYEIDVPKCPRCG